MGQLLKPTPDFSALDIANVHLADPKPSGDLTLEHDASQCADFTYLVFRQFYRAASLTSVACAMGKLISTVFLWSFPRQMTLCDAPQMSMATTVRGVMVRRWWRTVLFFADKAMNVDVLAFAFAFNSTIPFDRRIRPRQALVSFIGHHDITEIALRLAARCLLRFVSQRIAVSSPALVMHAAPAVSGMGAPMGVALATVYRACFEVYSHHRTSNVRSWSGLKLVLTHRFGPLFMPEKSETYNHGRA